MESNQATMNSCFNLMRRLPPNNIEKNIAGLSTLIENEDLRDEIIQKIDQPLEIEQDTSVHQDFLKCEFNRDGDSYRSPWSNKYFPEANEDSLYPSAELLSLEQKANDVFKRYAMLYFDQALTSVYFFDTNHDGFGACFLIKKVVDIKQDQGIKEGCWDSIHVVTVSLEQKKAKYRVASTVFLKMISSNESYGDLNISGSLSKSKEDQQQMDQKSNDDFHLANIGRLIEENETLIRQEMDGIYINKTKQIINTGRLREEYMTQDEKINFQNELSSKMSQMKMNAKVLQ